MKENDPARAPGRLPRIAGLASLILACFAMPLTSNGQQASASDEPVVLVLDGSNSMWGQIDGQTKISLARSAFGDILSRIEANRPVGLIAYGHRKASDCGDIEVISAPGTGNRDLMAAAVDAITPRGRTPITQALGTAARTLDNRKGSIVLVSDGIETCGGDPCALAAQLKADNLDLVAHVIGVDIQKPEEKAALSCIADATGGTYYDVIKSADLGLALERTTQTPATPVASPDPELVALDPATLTAPDTAELGTMIEVEWSGPGGEFDRIGVYVPGADVRDALVSGLVLAGNPLPLRMPGQEGSFELRYVASDGESVLATRPILLMPLKGAIQAPDTVEAGYSVPVRWATNFDPETDYVTIVPVDAPDSTYAVSQFLRTDGVSLRAPGTPGLYEIRVVREAGDVNTVQERKPIRIEPSAANLDAPTVVWAGSGFTVIASGPGTADGEDDVYLTITRPDEGAGSYSHGYDYVHASGDAINLKAPEERGMYELRYVIVSQFPQILARQQLEVK